MTRTYVSHKRAFTDAFCDTAKPGIYTDLGARGLRFRVAPSGGAKTFYHQFQLRHQGQVGTRGARKRGPILKVHVGRYPGTTLAEARATVNAQRSDVLDGVHPVQFRPVVEVAGGKTFGEVAQMFLASRENTTTHNDVARYLIPVLGGRSIAQVTRREVAALLDEVHDPRSRSREVRVLGHLSKIFGLAFDRGYIDDDPTVRMRRTYETEERDRTLSVDELLAVWDAAGDGGFGSAVKLLILSGQRRKAVSRMSWDDLDLANGIWTSPWEGMKGGSRKKGDLAVFLSRPAVDVLTKLKAARKKDAGPYVFSANGKNGRTPITGWETYKRKLTKALGDMPAWRIHDLRHTVVSGLADLGVAPHVVSRIVGHTLGQTVSAITQGYVHSDFSDEKREAMERWGEHLFPAPKGVVRLADRRKA